MSIGERLRKARLAANLTQQKVADELKIERPAYTAYESNRHQLSAVRIAQLACLFSVSSDYLLGLTDDPTPRDDAADHALAHKLAASPEATHVYAATEEELAAQLPEGIRDAVLALVNVAVETKIQAEKEQRDRER